MSTIVKSKSGDAIKSIYQELYNDLYLFPDGELASELKDSFFALRKHNQYLIAALNPRNCSLISNLNLVCNGFVISGRRYRVIAMHPGFKRGHFK